METTIKPGQKYGRLTVIEIADKDGSGHVRALCCCECGNLKEVRVSHLAGGKVKSCGCLHGSRTAEQIERLISSSRTHGGTGSRLYWIWDHMRRRCNNPRDPAFKDYGGRGILVCHEWESFEIFRAWALTNGYADGLTIERIDNNGIYTAANCSWIPNAEQQVNRRNNVRVEYNGRIVTLTEAARLSGISRQTIRDRQRRGEVGNQLFRPAKVRT